jgi:hypothetical protein
MKIQVFSQYYNLARAGKVKPLYCPNHQSEYAYNDGYLYWLVHKMVSEDIVLYCTACGYEQKAGLQLYENILKEIVNVT